jgi:ribosome biogenesis GTPase
MKEEIIIIMPSIMETYGWNEHWQQIWDDGSYEGLEPARVTARWRGQWEVACGEGLVLAQLTGKFRREQPDDAYPEVGDFVGVRAEQGSAAVAALLPRRSALVRHMAFSVSGRQVVAANVDVAFAAMALDRDYNLRRMERYVAAIAEGGILPVALLTKTDLCAGYWAKAYALRDAFPGMEALPVCALTGEGMEELRGRLSPGRTAVIVGSSGVGKSTLLNALYGSEVMRVGDLRSDGARGAHTTTNRQMTVLPGGALFIDTPGMRELGVVGEGEGLGEAFADIAELAAACRFRDCTHMKEPGCAVQKAIEDGALDPKRLKSWRSISAEMEREAKKAEYRYKYLRRSDRETKRREAMNRDIHEY